MPDTIPQPTTIELSDDKERSRQYHKEYHKEYYQRNKERNKERYKERSKEYYLQNKERLKECYKEYHQRNKEHCNTLCREYNQRNKEAINQYIQSRRKTDPLYKAKSALRNVVLTAFKRIGQNKPTNTEALLGCTWEEARQHFESKFLPGMNWLNHGEWHIDHIRPVSSFTESDLHLMNHISNLQPLWAEDNIRKGDRY